MILLDGASNRPKQSIEIAAGGFLLSEKMAINKDIVSELIAAHVLLLYF